MSVSKIAYLAPLYFDEKSYLGGGERYPLNLAKGVVEASDGRIEVELISFGEAPHRQTMAPGVSLRVLTAAGKPLHPLDMVSWELPEALSDVDLVHIHQAYTRCSEAGMLVAKQLRKPICVTDHGGTSSPFVEHLGILELADQIIAQSDFAASFFRTSTPIEVIKGGVDASRFTPSPVPVVRDRVLYLGRLLPHKGIDKLIAAMPPELPLTVCGRAYDAPYYELLQKLAKGKCVEFITDADDERILDLYRRAWVNILPSVHLDCFGNLHTQPELMGLSILEAMSCGTPAMSSRVAAMPEFIIEGETGFVFDDPDDLAAALRLLAANPGLVEWMGKRARRRVEQEYDYRVAGGRLVEIYDRLIARTYEVAA
ncbi:glycosyltransferase family 4 protein [Singulisphaera sp. PoT]|uniref:glycosyltransferase family 4 protein n=1 Tax=Singulisphaera sp. PoT TaxID=3411797 RepID=UPI003BF5D7E7